MVSFLAHWHSIVAICQLKKECYLLSPNTFYILDRDPEFPV